MVKAFGLGTLILLLLAVVAAIVWLEWIACSWLVDSTLKVQGTEGFALKVVCFLILTAFLAMLGRIGKKEDA